MGQWYHEIWVEPEPIDWLELKKLPIKLYPEKYYIDDIWAD